MLIRDAQNEHFATARHLLSNNQLIKNKLNSSVSSFLDCDQIISAAGRLSNSNFSYHDKHPVLITSHHPIAKIIIQYYVKLKHQGRRLASTAIRSADYLSQKCSELMKTIIKGCFICNRLHAPLTDQYMSDLPKHRISHSPPFTYAGIDLCGISEIKHGMRKSAGVEKV